MNVPSSLLTPSLGLKDPKWSPSPRSSRLGFVSQMTRVTAAALQSCYCCFDHFHLSAVTWPPPGHCLSCCSYSASSSLTDCVYTTPRSWDYTIDGAPPVAETTDLHTAHRFLFTAATSSNSPVTIASLPCHSLGKYFLLCLTRSFRRASYPRVMGPLRTKLSIPHPSPSQSS